MRDFIGVPLCPAVDHQTLANDTVTARCRATGEPSHLPMMELHTFIIQSITPFRFFGRT
ncbi:hypothetical protein IC235_11080 [Hymenobacter sp. BT664]|uniref:Anticodon-binding domain-containing protein n=1 Tax=Hymenobacter montanus TaxID=2771359 RepID=A0A927BEC9_9BACT|nr:hypothetical protein [Hymenobacter montanus]